MERSESDLEQIDVLLALARTHMLNIGGNVDAVSFALEAYEFGTTTIPSDEAWTVYKITFVIYKWHVDW